MQKEEQMDCQCRFCTFWFYVLMNIAIAVGVWIILIFAAILGSRS